MTRTTRIYLVGAGVIARFHAQAAQRLPGETQLIVADPNPAARADFAGRFPQARLFDNATTMLAEPAQSGDIVVLATPPFTRLALGTQALSSGRHVLCEKPLAMNAQEAEQLLALAKARNLLIGCCSARFVDTPTTREAKRLVDSGSLGAVYHATFVQRVQRFRTGIEYQPTSRWFLDSSKNGGGIVMDWTPYDFTMLNSVLAPVRVEVVDAWLANPATHLSLPAGTVFDVEEHAGATLRFHRADGTKVNVTYERASCTHGEARSVLEIEGTQGAVRWNWLMIGGKGELTHTTDVDGKPSSVTQTFDKTELPPHDRPLHYLWKRIAGQPSAAVVNADAVFNFRCLRAVYDCANTGQPQSIQREGQA
ncbi:MAG: Inositol 2-dehydrogenase/D-chiro-inositol 3-dehydrogenase [Verrucomicrobiae bacterium]|nr:Inositol 2-dehydrogenase/D-chiro-inositol 3-dehydrogenase [Verrucomicrobiae bacterium]